LLLLLLNLYQLMSVLTLGFEYLVVLVVLTQVLLRLQLLVLEEERLLLEKRREQGTVAQP
jgi:hypothetical protein